MIIVITLSVHIARRNFQKFHGVFSMIKTILIFEYSAYEFFIVDRKKMMLIVLHIRAVHKLHTFCRGNGMSGLTIFENLSIHFGVIYVHLGHKLC